MLESIRVLNGWHCKYYKVIQTLWKRRVVKQDESNGDLEFIMTIGLELWRQVDNLFKYRQKTILKMDKSIQGFQKPHIGL